MTTRFVTLLAAAALAGGLASCSRQAPDEADAAVEDHDAHGAVDDGAAPSIDVVDGWVRSTPVGNDVTAAYFTLANAGGADRLIGAASSQVERVELHASTVDENNVTRMAHLDHGVDVPAGGEAAFTPGANHLMLFGAAGLKLGDTLCLTLDFERADDRIACLPVMDEAPL